MTLAVGTTLQHGTYVIDAWVEEDAIGPVYLAMHVPTGQWVQLRILGSRRLGQLPEEGDRQRFYQYLDQVKRLGNRGFPALLGGFEEEGICYQTLVAPKGSPLDRWVTPIAPLGPRRSLAIVYHLIDQLEVLRPLGWAGLQLTPDQVWCADGSDEVCFTGFDLAMPAADQLADQEPAVVKGLGQLLYFLLTGQRAEATQAPLAVEVRRQHPTLPGTLDRALALVQLSAPELATVSLADWRSRLPAIADLPIDPPPPQPTQVVTGADNTGADNTGILTVAGSRPAAQAGPPRAIAKPRTAPAVALGLTGLVATVAGLGVGFHLRLQPASSTASQERLNPNQSFPPQPNWNGDTLWQPWEDAPALRNRPYYGTTPPPNSAPAKDHAPDPTEPAAPPPAVTQPAIATPDPLPPWEDLAEPASPQVEPAPPEPTNPTPLPDPTVAPAPIAPPPPLEAPPPSRPIEVAPPPLNAPAPAPTPASS